MNKIKSKLPGVGNTIFAEMTKMAYEYDAINLSQGFPNFGSPSGLIKRVCHHMETGKNQYPPMPGVPGLKRKLADKFNGLYGADLDPDTEITITAGATQAIQMAITAFVREGDNVIIFDPAYDVYGPCVRLNGAFPKHIKLNPPDFKIDWKAVEKSIDEYTSLIIVNTPHNPSGTIFEEEDMRRLQQIVNKQDILVLSDEVYQHIVFEDRDHQSVTRYPELRKRSLAAFSFGKTYHVTGWKVGYLVAPESLTAEFRKIFQYGMFAVSTPMQYALSDYLDRSQHYLELANFYQQKRDLFRDILQQTRFELLPCQGTYYQCASFDGVSNEPDTKFVKRLIKEYGVAAIPISPFYHDDYDSRIIRFCFAKTDETLERAGEKLIKV